MRRAHSEPGVESHANWRRSALAAALAGLLVAASGPALPRRLRRRARTSPRGS